MSIKFSVSTPPNNFIESPLASNQMVDFYTAWKTQINIPSILMEKVILMLEEYYKMVPMIQKKQAENQVLFKYNAKLIETIDGFITYEKKIVNRSNRLCEMYVKSFKKYAQMKNWALQDLFKPIPLMLEHFSLKDWKLEPSNQLNFKISKPYHQLLLQQIKKHYLNQNQFLEKLLQSKQAELLKRSTILPESTLKQIEQLHLSIRQLNDQCKSVNFDNMFDILDKYKFIESDIRDLEIEIEGFQNFSQVESRFEQRDEQFIKEVARIHAMIEKFGDEEIKTLLRDEREIRKKLRKLGHKAQNRFQMHLEKIQSENNDLKSQNIRMKAQIDQQTLEITKLKLDNEIYHMRQNPGRKGGNTSVLYEEGSSMISGSYRDGSKRLQAQNAQLRQKNQELKKELQKEKKKSINITQEKDLEDSEYLSSENPTTNKEKVKKKMLDKLKEMTYRPEYESFEELALVNLLIDNYEDRIQELNPKSIKKIIAEEEAQMKRRPTAVFGGVDNQSPSLMEILEKKSNDQQSKLYQDAQIKKMKVVVTLEKERVKNLEIQLKRVSDELTIKQKELIQIKKSGSFEAQDQKQGMQILCKNLNQALSLIKEEILSDQRTILEKTSSKIKYILDNGKKRSSLNNIPILPKTILIEDEEDDHEKILIYSQSLQNKLVDGKGSNKKSDRLFLSSKTIGIHLKSERSMLFEDKQLQTTPIEFKQKLSSHEEDQYIQILSNFVETPSPKRKPKVQVNQNDELSDSFIKLGSGDEEINKKIAADAEFLKEFDRKMQQLKNNEDTNEVYLMYSKYKQSLSALELAEKTIKSNQIKRQEILSQLASQTSDSKFKLEERIYFLTQRVKQQNVQLAEQKEEFQTKIKDLVGQIQGMSEKVMQTLRKV